MAGMPDEGASSVQRVIAILTALGEHDGTPGNVGVVEVARLVGREKSQISRTLRTLAESGLRRPRPGHARATGSAGGSSPSPRGPVSSSSSCARPRSCAGSSTRSANASTSPSSTAPTPARSCPRTRRARCRPRTSSAALPRCTRPRAGRRSCSTRRNATSACCSTAASFVAHGPKAPKDVDEFIARVRRAAGKGFATCVDEFDADLAAAAAPVRDLAAGSSPPSTSPGRSSASAATSPPPAATSRSAAGYLSENLGWRRTS